MDVRYWREANDRYRPIADPLRRVQLAPVSPADAYFLPAAFNEVDLANWSDLVPARADVLRLTLFADVILRATDSSVHMLEVAACGCSQITATEEEIWQRVQADESGWQLRPLADRCRDDRKALGPGQCYGFKTPPLLGGAYEPENIWVAPLAEWLSFMGDLHQQTRTLPDGTSIRLTVGD